MTTHYVKAILEIAVDSTDEHTALSDLEVWLNTKGWQTPVINETQIEGIFVGQLDILEWTP